MGHRRKAREYALQGLYMYETGTSSLEDLYGLYWVDKEVPADTEDFSRKLIQGSIENIEQIDDLIKKYSKNWKFERIDIVDKSILRISIYALLYLPDIPAVVTINEGIELGKIYGGETSGQFINGILDTVHKSEFSKEKK